MPLSPEQEETWSACLAELQPYTPALLPVDEPIDSVAGFWGAIEDAWTRGQISEETYGLAHDFMGEVVRTPNPNATLGQLQYIEELKGLYLRLTLGGIDEQA